MKSGEHTAHHDPSGKKLVSLAMAALGVVYGDIGTSPLYALEECFAAHPDEHGVMHHPILATPDNVLGIVSLFFWALTLAISIKYLTFIMRADNHGEGGILALLALSVPPKTSLPAAQSSRDTKPPEAAVGFRRIALIGLGLFGAALLYGDGVITPAISVLSAVEGINEIPEAHNRLEPFIVPITCAILIALFVVQRRGTAGIGALFGPVTLFWFFSIAAAGLPWIFREPRVFEAMLPTHAIRFLAHHGRAGFLVLGSVVLCITGGEALYADMGHFGRKPIRFAWWIIVLPALLLNYLGQGALLLSKGQSAADEPFYGLVSGWVLYPMIAIATAATVVASQALISGAYSLTRQAIQLGYMPRMEVKHTSAEEEGQIYMPGINTALMVSCVALVLAFQASSRLAAAYGIAVTGTMAITSILFFDVMHTRWGVLRTGLLVAAFLVIDLAFFAANAVKILHGGWFPLVVAAGIFVLMTTWKRGRSILAERMIERQRPVSEFMEEIAEDAPPRVPGTAVFMTSSPNGAPAVLLHHYKHNKTLHEQVVLLSIMTDRRPRVGRKRRVEVEDLGNGFFRVVAHYGFMQSPRVIEILEAAAEISELRTHVDETSFYLGRESLLSTRKGGMRHWRKALFALMSQNARPATSFFNVPADRVVEIGMQIEL